MISHRLHQNQIMSAPNAKSTIKKSPSFVLKSSRKKQDSKEPSETDPKTVISLQTPSSESLLQNPKPSTPTVDTEKKDKRQSFLGGGSEKKYKLFSKSNSRTSLPPPPTGSSSNSLLDQSAAGGIADKSAVSGVSLSSASRENFAVRSSSNLETTPEKSTEKLDENPPTVPIVEPGSLSVYRVGDIVIAVKKHTPQDLNEIEVAPGDLIEVFAPANEQDFWLAGINLVEGKRNGQKGYLPKSYVRINRSSETSRHTTNSSGQDDSYENSIHSADSPDPPTSAIDGPQHVRPGTQAIARFSYEKGKNDEISFNAGDTIVVLKCIDGGWWKGINASESGSKVPGFFPVNLVTIINDDSVKEVEDLPDLNLDESPVSPTTMTNFKKRLVSSPGSVSVQVSHDRTSSAPVASADVSSVNSPSSPARAEDIFSDDEEFGSTLMKAKSFADDYNAKARKSVGLKHSKKPSAAGEIHFEILQELLAAKTETLEEKLGIEVYNSLSEKEKKRLHGVLELVQTERDYVRDLVIIIEIFQKPMNSLTTLGAKNSALLFANIEQITAINYKFLSQMLELKITDVSAFAELFLNNMEKFMCYIPYCANQNQSWEKLTAPILNKTDIKQFLKDTHRNPSLRLLNIQGFLVKPVQRVCKYPLFIKEMIKNTAPGHADLIILNRAMEKVEQGLLTINESAKQLNGFKSLLDIQARFAEKLSMTNSSRFILREDAVTAMYANKQTKARRIMLFNDLLIISKNNHWNSKKLHLVEKVPLKDIRLYDVTDEDTAAIIEMEILPQFESDSTKHYVFAYTSKSEKQIFITSYKSLLRTAVKVKSIKDVLFIESRAEEDVEQHDPKSAATIEIHELSEKVANLEKEILLKSQSMNTIKSQSEGWEKKCSKLEADLEELRQKASQQAELLLSKDIELQVKNMPSPIIEPPQTDIVTSAQLAETEAQMRAQALILSEKESALGAQALLLLEKDTILTAQAKSLFEKDSIIAEQLEMAQEKDSQISALKFAFESSTAEFQSLSKYQQEEIVAKLEKANENLAARAESRENLKKAFNDQFVKMGSLASNEDSLKNQVLELNVQIASLELSSSQAQNQIQNEKKDLLTMLERKQQELAESERRVNDLEESFIEETRILERELDHLQKELADEKKSTRHESENVKAQASTIKSLELQIIVLDEKNSKSSLLIQEQAKDKENLIAQNSELNGKLHELITSQAKKDQEQMQTINELGDENHALKAKLEISANNLSTALSNVKVLQESQKLLEVENHELLDRINSLEEEKLTLSTANQALSTDRQEALRLVDQTRKEKMQIVESMESGNSELVSAYEANVQKLSKLLADGKDAMETEKRALSSQISNLTDTNKNLERLLHDSGAKLETAERATASLKEDYKKLQSDKAAELEALVALHSDQLKLKMAILETMEINKNALQESLKVSERKLNENDAEIQKLKLANFNDTAAISTLKNSISELESEKLRLQSTNTDLADKISRLTEDIQSRLQESELKLQKFAENAQEEKNALSKEYQRQLAEKDHKILSLEESENLLDREMRSKLSEANSKFENSQATLKSEIERLALVSEEKERLALSINQIQERFQLLEGEKTVLEESNEKLRRSAAEDKLQQAKDFDQQLQSQVLLIQGLESSKAALSDEIINLKSELSRNSSEREALKHALSEKDLEFNIRISSLTDQTKKLKEDHQQAVSILENEISNLTTRLHSESKDSTSKIQDLSEKLAFKDGEYILLQAKLTSLAEASQQEDNRLKNEIDNLKKLQESDGKFITELQESAKLAEQSKNQLESSIAMLNAKLIESESNASILKESLTSSQMKTFDDLKSKEDLYQSHLKAKDDAIAELEKTRTSLQITCSSIEEKFISLTAAFDKLTFERDNLQIESNTIQSQVSLLQTDNAQLSTRIVELGNSIESKLGEIASLESQLLTDRASLNAQRVELEKEMADQIAVRDSSITALKSKIKILEKSLEDDIAKLSTLEHNPSPNPKEVLNAHILRKKLQDKYLIASETIAKLEKDLHESNKSANERLKRAKEDGRLKLEIGAKAIAALEVKIEKYIHTTEILKLENSTTMSKLMSAMNALEVAQRNLTEKESSLQGIVQEKQGLLTTISNMSSQMSDGMANLSSQFNSLQLSSSKEKEFLTSTISSLEAEKKQLHFELESTKNGHIAYSAAYETEKNHLLDEIKILNSSIHSKETDRLKIQADFSSERAELQSTLRSTQDELHVIQADLERKIIDIDRISKTLVLSRSSNETLNLKIRNLNQDLLSSGRDVFTARNVLKAEKAAVESGLRHQIKSMHNALKCTEKQLVAARKEFESVLAKMSMQNQQLHSLMKISNTTIAEQTQSIERLKTELQSKSQQYLDLTTNYEQLSGEFTSYKSKTSETESEKEAELKVLRSLKNVLESEKSSLEKEKQSLYSNITSLESAVSAEKDVNGQLLKSADGLRKTIATLDLKINELEGDRGTLVEGYEKSLASKTGTIGLLEQKVKILQESLGSDFTKGLNNLQQVAEAEKKLLIAEKKTLNVEKQVIEQEKINLSRELEKMLQSKEQTVLDLTIKMKDVQQKLRAEIDIAQKQIQELKDLYLKEREQHLNTEMAFRDMSVLKSELEARMHTLDNNNKGLESKTEELKLQMNDFKIGAANDLQSQATSYNKQLLLKSSKIENLHSKNSKLAEQISGLKKELDSLRDELTISRRGVVYNGEGNKATARVTSTETQIQDTKKRIQQLEREKERISLEAAQSHSNEVRLLNVINDKSTEIRNVMRRIIELESMNDRLNNGGGVPKLPSSGRKVKKAAVAAESSPTAAKSYNSVARTSDISDMILMDRQVKFLKDIIQMSNGEKNSLQNTISELCRILKIPFSWQSVSISSLLERTNELAKGQINIRPSKSQEIANTQFLLQIVEKLQVIIREKEKAQGQIEKQREFLNEIEKQQRLSNLKLEQSQDTILHLQSKLENKMLPGETISKRATPKEFKQARTVAQYEILERLFKKTASELSNCQSHIMELDLEKAELEKAFKELYEQMVNQKAGFQHRILLTESEHNTSVSQFKSEIERLHSIISGLRTQTTRLHTQKTRADELLKDSMISARSLAAFIQ